MYGCIVVGHRVCIVIHIVDALHTRLCYFTLSASFLYSSFRKPKNSPPLLHARLQAQLVHGSYSHCDPRVKGQNANRLQTLALCVCKPGFAKLSVEYSEDQRSQRIVSAVNNAFSVHSDHVQDIVVT